MTRGELRAGVACIVIGAAIAVAAACGAPSSAVRGPAPAADNPDPRRGWVGVDAGVTKFCDGPTLVYRIGTGGTVIPNSPECKP